MHDTTGPSNQWRLVPGEIKNAAERFREKKPGKFSLEKMQRRNVGRAGQTMNSIFCEPAALRCRSRDFYFRIQFVAIGSILLTSALST